MTFKPIPPTTVTFCVFCRRLPSLTPAEFQHEFTVVHANATRSFANEVGILHAYTQRDALSQNEVDLTNGGTLLRTKVLDAGVELVWSNPETIYASFQLDSYKKDAGAHIFAEPETTIVLQHRWEWTPDRPAAVVAAATNAEQSSEEQGEVMLEFVLVKKSDQSLESFDEAYQTYLKKVVGPLLSSESNVKRYRSFSLPRHSSAPSPDVFWKGTQFAKAYHEVHAKEQYYFSSTSEAKRWIETNAQTLKKGLTGFVDEDKSWMSAWGTERRLVNSEARSMGLKIRGRLISWVIRAKTAILGV